MIDADLEWMNEGLCRGKTAIFYPKADAGRESVYDAAKQVCLTPCPVFDVCLDYAWPPVTGPSVGNLVMRGDKLRRPGRGEEHGCWGGTSPSDRGFGKSAKVKDAEPGNDQCEHCGASMKRVGIKKYCGERCQRDAARQPVEPTAPALDLGPDIRCCKQCGRQFEKVEPGQRHCSKQCVRDAFLGRESKGAAINQTPVRVYQMSVEEASS